MGDGEGVQGEETKKMTHLAARLLVLAREGGQGHGRGLRLLTLALPLPVSSSSDALGTRFD